jgi:hypothetical protein
VKVTRFDPTAALTSASYFLSTEKQSKRSETDAAVGPLSVYRRATQVDDQPGHVLPVLGVRKLRHFRSPDDE